MNYYLIAKFIHIVGALGFFIALAVEWWSLRNLRHAKSLNEIQEWIRVARGVQRLGAPSMAATLLSGFYMMAVARLDAAWPVVSFGALIVLALLAVIVTQRRVARIWRSLEMATESSYVSLLPLLRQPLLWIVTQIRVALALGIVFLMTLKPDLMRSLLTIGMAALLGLVLALATLRHEQARGETDQPERELYQA